MGVCDAHEAVFGRRGTISSDEGYLLAARFMQNSKVQDRNIDIHIALYKQLGRSMSREETKLEMESVQGAAPWLICEECADFLELSNMDKEAARGAARKWWKDKSTPGHIPGQKTTERNKKPAYFMIFGNGFTPSAEQAHLILRVWVEKVKNTLGEDIWERIRMELRSRDRSSIEEFIKVVPEVKKAHTGQLVDDILLLDKKTGQDMALIAVWAPEDSEYVGSLLKQDKAERPAVTEEKTEQIQEPVGEKPKDIYEVLMDAICCVMCADRKVTTRERKAVHTIMEKTKAPWSEGQVKNRINDFIQRVNRSGLNNVIQQTCDKLSEFKKIGKEEVLLRCIGYMALADGIVDKKERQLMDKFKFVLGIKSVDLVDSATQVRTPKSGEKARAKAITREQQKALWLRSMELWAAGQSSANVTVVTIGESGTKTSGVSPEVAKWAAPILEMVGKADNLAKQGKYMEATNAYKQVLNKAPNAAIALMSIGICYCYRGDKANALKWLQQAKSADPDNKRVIKNLQIAERM